MNDEGETTGADFAASFLRAVRRRGATDEDLSIISAHQLAHWFDLALEQGRRTQPPAPGWVMLTSASADGGQMAIRPEDIVVVAARPGQPTSLLVDGSWLSVTEGYEDVIRRAAIP